MAGAKLAPNLPQWMVDHANRYISSGGNEGHIYTITPPGYAEMHVPSSVADDDWPEIGRARTSFRCSMAKKATATLWWRRKAVRLEHPNWYRNLVVSPEVEVQAGDEEVQAKGPARPARSVIASGKRR